MIWEISLTESDEMSLIEHWAVSTRLYVWESQRLERSIWIHCVQEKVDNWHVVKKYLLTIELNWIEQRWFLFTSTPGSARATTGSLPPSFHLLLLLLCFTLQFSSFPASYFSLPFSCRSSCSYDTPPLVQQGNFLRFSLSPLSHNNKTNKETNKYNNQTNKDCSWRCWKMLTVFHAPTQLHVAYCGATVVFHNVLDVVL